LAETLSFPFRLEILALTLVGWVSIYFFVNRRPVEPHRRLDLGTDLDRRTPYLTMFVPVYFSTYPFVLMPFLILSNARQFYWMLVTFVSISAVSSFIHATIPSKIERVEQVSIGGASGWILDRFQKTCKPHGNFPSMHVGLSIPAVASCFMAFGTVVGSITLVWAILIALSTLYTKQHYILDVLVGFVVGALIFGLTFWLMLAR
jgi:membrane-associated phospholipid phosphatase